MKPTIGRIVHYQAEVLKHPHKNNTQETIVKTYPAIIMEVAEDVPVYDESGKVKQAAFAGAHLYVFGFSGDYNNWKPTPFSEEPKVGHWSWPPKV